MFLQVVIIVACYRFINNAKYKDVDQEDNYYHKKIDNFTNGIDNNSDIWDIPRNMDCDHDEHELVTKEKNTDIA